MGGQFGDRQSLSVVVGDAENGEHLVVVLVGEVFAACDPVHGFGEAGCVVNDAGCRLDLVEPAVGDDLFPLPYLPPDRVGVRISGMGRVGGEFRFAYHSGARAAV